MKNMKKQECKQYKIDASGQVLGRLATQIAVLLRGKNRVDFAPNREPNVLVKVFNIDKIKLTGRKESKKIYYRHSGYPGGLKLQTYRELFKKNPGEVVRRAVLGMLPKNKLRSIMIKNLKFSAKLKTSLPKANILT